uniref:Peptidase, M20/M25/M40 family n=1 Tax=Nonomuraea gerenzanensis TaxID=93944 RepID=A0A1M4DW10_9ACTN|nr:Peptidase, M20/M25/M40 family [Nonomuraea gerenzanensis]
MMDAGTRTAAWVSADLAPSDWTRTYVSGKDTAALPPGYARGDLWTGRAPAVDVDGPRVRVLGKDGGTYRLRISAGRGARSLTLRVERPIAEVTAKADGMRAVTVPVTGVRANTWPGEVRFRGIPAGGAEITVRVMGEGELRMTAIGERDGFAAVPGFTPMPPGLVAATREDGGLVAITRTYRL